MSETKKPRTTTKAASAKAVRRARARRLGIRSAIWVGIPTVLAIVYYGFWATPQYESVTTFSIQSSKARPSLGGLGAIIGVGSGSGQDANLVVEYIASRDMLAHLDQTTGLIAHYKSKKADRWSRLDGDANSEEIFEYYKEKVQAGVSDKTSTVTLRVRAFSADKAQQIAKATLAASESMVNKITERARQDRLDVAQKAVTEMEARYSSARNKLLKLQGDQAMLDPREAAKGVGKLVVELEGQLVEARAKLSALQAVLQPNAPKVIAARKLVGSLQYQLKRQKAKLVGSGKKSVKASLAELEPVFIEKELAQRGYEAAMKALELARLDASRQVRYLVTISAPSHPDAPTHPRRMWGIATVFVVSVLLMGIFSLLVASVREHGKF